MPPVRPSVSIVGLQTKEPPCARRLCMGMDGREAARRKFPLKLATIRRRSGVLAYCFTSGYCVVVCMKILIVLSFHFSRDGNADGKMRGRARAQEPAESELIKSLLLLPALPLFCSKNEPTLSSWLAVLSWGKIISTTTVFFVIPSPPSLSPMIVLSFFSPLAHSIYHLHLLLLDPFQVARFPAD